MIVKVDVQGLISTYERLGVLHNVIQHVNVLVKMFAVNLISLDSKLQL